MKMQDTLCRNHAFLSLYLYQLLGEAKTGRQREKGDDADTN